MHGFRIGKISGVEIRVDWSWVFIFVLLTWNLVSMFSRWHLNWSPLETGVVAGSASLLFFGCILLHELAHSVVAKRYGLRVRSITLFLLGGVSNIEHEPSTPKSEFFIAIVGPLTSIALGIAFLVLASTTTISPVYVDGSWSGLARLGPFSTLLAWLGPINILIGCFNLIPGFPLDGGRVLRSALWGITGDFRASTRWASATGQAVGWMFFGCGLAMSFGVRVPFFGTGVVSGIWLAFIGWFLHSAARRTTTRLSLDDALAGMTVEQLMQRNGLTATPHLSVESFVHERLLPGEDRALAVVEDGLLLGLVSASEVRGVPPAEWPSTTVGSVMRKIEDLAVATPDEPLTTAFEELAQKNIELLPVVVSGRLVGVLRRRDVARWIELAWKPGAAMTNPAAAPRGPIAPASSTRDRTAIGEDGVHHAA